MSVHSDQIGIWKCWFLRRGENRSTRRKTSRSKGENQQQTQPTYGVRESNITQLSYELDGTVAHTVLMDLVGTSIDTSQAQ